MVVRHRLAPVRERELRIDFLRLDERVFRLRIREVVQQKDTAQERRLRLGLSGIRKHDRAELEGE